MIWDLINRCGLDPDFHELLMKLHKTNSASLQKSLLAAEVQSLRLKMYVPAKSATVTCHLVVRAMFCEMMGYDTSDFAHLPAIMLCQNARTLYEKRLAHLAASIFLQGNQKMSLLMTNTLQKDLGSSNHFEVTMALSVLSATSTVDMVPLLIKFVEKNLKHPNEMIRRKAVHAFYRFYQLDNQAVYPYIKKLKRSLADTHPSVMSAALITLNYIAKDFPEIQALLAPAVVHILKQVLNHRLDATYNYHSVPAPFIQLNCLRMIAMFGPLSQEMEQTILVTVLESLHQVNARQQDDIVYMIILQCVQTIAARSPSPDVLKNIMTVIGPLATSTNISELHLGVQCLTAVTMRSLNLHQSAVDLFIKAYNNSETDLVLKYSIIEALMHTCQELGLARTLIPMLLDTMRSFMGNAYMQQCCINHILAMLKKYDMDRVLFCKAVLDSVEIIPDECRGNITNTITTYVTDGSILADTALARGIEWLENPAHPPLLTWLAVWICRTIGSHEVLGKIAVLLNHLISVDSGLNTDLIAHVIETCTKISSSAEIKSSAALTEAIKPLCDSAHPGIAILCYGNCSKALVFAEANSLNHLHIK
ncbi:hypothetical protein BATDEDRAFT_87257 [Batrachochytrium dendrobatidis JAM81]|uniref:Clathrin/coatomer adaptor adaptin-like N-terminal domain-containing protein n=1 Tax=Batrachochytrium dendrobatidis (strain JAM81 / FGSC 10211) TaxID=684364 RepID=F4NZ29_BATDJ|nr:uncharacterized protein BATDEDRAFT_87257 [Batrachochytrium dendrobatidis JAM81]EGF81811.1 hypothetical protein BATDEDRAFT_87257 [Batrachochytrium dendrobatidis JAM81]|eukprot:XP_006677542.1 hypothetical protein BATDEDRAFT_87257 [Batrachochytrium dendrobatidis JAM81]